MAKAKQSSRPVRWGTRVMDDHFEILKQVGEGTYGKVYKARDKASGEIVALKMCKLEKATEGFPVTAIREIKILRALKHKNIVDLKEIATSRPRSQRPTTAGKKGAATAAAAAAAGGGGGAAAPAGSPDEEDEESRGSVYLVFEYLDYDLTGLMEGDMGIDLSPMHIKCYMKQLLEGIHTAHKNKILHRDIKCSNLLVGNDGYLKIGDWGLARPTNDTLFKNLTSEVITLWYRPPELLMHDYSKSRRSQYTSAVDMWSVGCIFAEMLYKKAILPGKDQLQQLEFIFALLGAPTEESWPGVEKLDHFEKFKGMGPPKNMLKDKFRLFPPEALSLVERLLTLDPAKRISAHEALDHDYFWTDPLPCEPKDLPKFKVESAHELDAKARKQAGVEAQYAARQQQWQAQQQRRPGAGGAQRQQRRPLSAAAKAAQAAGSGR